MPDMVTDPGRDEDGPAGLQHTHRLVADRVRRRQARLVGASLPDGRVLDSASRPTDVPGPACGRRRGADADVGPICSGDAGTTG
jgi:hypothetical protein